MNICLIIIFLYFDTSQKQFVSDMLRITNSSTIFTPTYLQGLEFYCQPITEIHVFKEKYKGDSKRGTGRMKLDSRVYITRA